ncbi:hypothetical protein [Bacillus taeanensis]|uniref:HAD family hydrolase n=1 Tax=Bacillus taeanensis TaxID=273032 RepID=A0A366XTM7_9BACI|nr:hypothetical protein [Bacillus taeanensis]RBW68898.1 hypothetical protein DS031_14270 [Bacillus taeanensis]
MGKFSFKNVLFMSNFTIDMGDPNFRTGAYTKYLDPLANTLSKVNNLDVKFLLSKHTFESVKREAKPTKINNNNSFIVDYGRDTDIFGFGDAFIRKSYNDNFTSEERAYINGYFKSLFKGWEPDLIICWEFPTTIFRAMFPNALVIDLMPGLFMRPPYPRTISLDPVGLYKDSVFGEGDLSTVKATPGELEAYYSIHNKFEAFYEENAVKELILSKLKGSERFKKFILVPLQISQYFGFYENCSYDSQFDFLIDVLKNTPEDTGVIATQYVSGFVQEKAINDKNIDFLTSNFPNFLYSKEFEKVDNISQFIVPWADATCSISSTIGLQAKFYNRKLISPSRSHLAHLADQTNLKTQQYSEENNNDHIMALMLSRQTFLESRLLGEPDYLASIFTEMAANKAKGKSGIDLLPNKNVVKSVKENPLHYSTASSNRAAVRQLNRLGHKGFHQDTDYLERLVKQIKEASVVSFDVFDTLLCRAVFKPEDVFAIMQKELSEGKHSIEVPNYITQTFAQLRAGVERQLRRERDAELAVKAEGTVEEITIHEVYSLMIERFGGKLSDVQKLIDLEQKIEWSVLKARPVGKFLFNEAIKAGKPVIIISDFIHEEAFVARALSNAGITEYTTLYVSSKIGKKKHSGDLFGHVAEELNVDTSTVLHIGDNPIGDLERAGAAGWNSVRISSARERALEILKERKLSPNIVNNSFFLRTALSMFAEEFYQIKTFKDVNEVIDPNKDRGFLENGVEFGFLALGPLLYSFSEWIIEQAKEKNCDAILFFARDCYLPSKIVKKILEARGEAEKFDVHYIATSRRGLMGLNLQSPEDFFKIRIDDYARKNPFSMLLENRFGLDPYAISDHILTRWSVEDIDIPVGKLTPAAIYGIVYEHVSENWAEVRKPFDEKRRAYKKYLQQQGIDLGKKTLGVDFGYKGSTHRMINSIFEQELQPAFFMTYSDDFGHDPIENAESYYLKNINPAYKSDIMLSHNLIIETLVNEATGSLIEVVEDKSSEIRVIKEELGSAEHLAKVNAIHRGVLQFADSWLRIFKDNPDLTSIEANSAEYLLDTVLRKPSKREAEVLKGMLFDNAFAGHNKRYILTPNEGAPDSESIWKEGHKALYSANAKAPVKKPSPKPTAPVKAASVQQQPAKNPAPKPAVQKQPAKSPKPKTAAPVKNNSKKPQIPEVSLKNNNIIVNGTSYPKDIHSLRVLHRNTFVESIALLAKLSPSKEVIADYANMVKDHPKKYVAAKLLKDYGGISNANISKKDKLKSYLSLLGKK